MKYILLLLAFISVFSTKAQLSENANGDKSAKNITGFKVIPGRLDFKLNKGETAYQPIKIYNGFDKTVHFKASIVDWDVDSIGALKVTNSNFGRSCKNWTSFNQDVIELGPGQNGEILVKLSVPESDSAVNEMKWCLVMLETVLENKARKDANDSTRLGVNINFKLGVYILQTPPTIIDKKDLQMLQFTNIPNKKNGYSITCLNTGKTRLECKGHIELLSLTTGEKTSLEPELFSVYPERKRITNFIIPDTVPKGKYTATVIVDAQDDEIPLQASEATIEVK